MFSRPSLVFNKSLWNFVLAAAAAALFLASSDANSMGDLSYDACPSNFNVSDDFTMLVSGGCRDDQVLPSVELQACLDQY